jgi:hypothetical protein
MTADAPETIAAMGRMGRSRSYETRGRFTEFEPYLRLAISHVIDFIPGAEPYESTILAEFIPAREKIRMVITLGSMYSEELTKMSTMGFTSQLSKLDRRFSLRR